MNTIISCNVCHKTYKTNANYMKHINLNRCRIIDKSVNCKGCNKIFSHKDARVKHEKRCVIYKSSLNSVEEIAKLHQKMDKMESTIINLLSNVPEPTNITNNNNNTQNIQNNIHVTLSYGEENMNHISIKDIISFLERGENGIEALVQYKHFNRDVPENHNVMIKNLNNKFALIYKEGRWEVVNKSYILEDLYTSNVTYLKGKFEEIKNNLPKKILVKFQKFLEMSRNVDIIEPILDNIRCILYNNRDLILELNKIKSTNGEELLMISSDEFNNI